MRCIPYKICALYGIHHTLPSKECSYHNFFYSYADQNILIQEVASSYKDHEHISLAVLRTLLGYDLITKQILVFKRGATYLALASNTCYIRCADKICSELISWLAYLGRTIVLIYNKMHMYSLTHIYDIIIFNHNQCCFSFYSTKQLGIIKLQSPP